MDTIHKIFQWESDEHDSSDEAGAKGPGRTPHGRRGKPEGTSKPEQGTIKPEQGTSKPEQGTTKPPTKDDSPATRKRRHSAANKAQEQKPTEENNKKAKQSEDPATQDTMTGMPGMDRVNAVMETVQLPADVEKLREPIQKLFDWDEGGDFSSPSEEDGTVTDWSGWLPAAFRRKKPVHVSGFRLTVCGAVRCGAVRCGAVRCGAVRCGAVRCGAVRCGAVRCGAVRCGAVRCGAVRCGAVRCGAVRCGAVRCGAVRCGAVRCGAVRCGAVRCGAVRCGAVRCGAVRCGAVRCGAVRCGAVRCCAMQHKFYCPGRFHNITVKYIKYFFYEYLKINIYEVVCTVHNVKLVAQCHVFLCLPFIRIMFHQPAINQ